MSNIKEKLFTEFEVPTTQQWLDKIEGKALYRV